jgi:hypothetical protein
MVDNPQVVISYITTFRSVVLLLFVGDTERWNSCEVSTFFARIGTIFKQKLLIFQDQLCYLCWELLSEGARLKILEVGILTPV